MQETIVIKPRFEEIADVTSSIASSLASARPDARALAAISEALLNAIVYGALGVTPERGWRDADLFLEAIRAAEARTADTQVVHVDLAWDGTTARVVVRDPGPGFDWAAALDALAATPLDPFTSRGRGLALMKAGADDLTWNETGNEVTLAFTRRSP